MVLAADIGGTNARLGLFELDGPTLRNVTIQRYPSRGHASLEEIVERFLAEVGRPVEAACFAVAGPVSEGRVVLTNLGWTVDARRLARAARLNAVRLINDLEGIAHGLDELGDTDVVLLHPGAPGAQGNRAIIAAGTGLGEAGAYWNGRRHHPFACEGGHADFGPRTHLEVDLLTSVLARHDRVSYERVLSGSGLYELYKFLRDSGHGEEPPWLTRELEQDPGPVVIVRAALERRDALCLEAVDLFVSIYGAEAGNLALKVMARGGVWIAGGIAMASRRSRLVAETSRTSTSTSAVPPTRRICRSCSTRRSVGAASSETTPTPTVPASEFSVGTLPEATTRPRHPAWEAVTFC